MIQLAKITETIILSRALYVCCDFKIADKLNDEPMNIEDLSKATLCDINALARLMRLLVLNNIFELSNAGLYSNTNFSETMRENHPYSVRPFLLHDDLTRWNSLGNLGYSIKTGKPAFDMLYSADYFSYIKNNQVLSERFNQAMLIISNDEDKIIAESVNFIGSIADIGGGTGQLINKIIEHNTQAKSCYLLELPSVNADFKYNNCTKISGSFFENFAINADNYILKRVLHDWDDEKAVIILKNIANNMNKNSKLFIFEGIINNHEDSRFLASVDLLLLSIFGGVERTLIEFEALFAKANLKIISNNRLTDMLSMMEIIKR